MLTSQQLKAQIIIPVEEYRTYWNARKGVPENSYIKDVNHVLDQYIGTWRGEQNGKTYVFYITKELDYWITSKSDRLVMRYTIHSATGQIIEDSRNDPSNTAKVVKGFLYNPLGGYSMRYNYNYNAGMVGFVDIKQSGISNKIYLKLTINAGLVLESQAEVGNQAALLPTDQILLTKQ